MAALAQTDTAPISPEAALQDISAAVFEGWLNLRKRQGERSHQDSKPPASQAGGGKRGGGDGCTAPQP